MSDDVNDDVVRVHGLSKVFKVYRRPSDMVLEMLTRRARHREFSALRDVTFDVKRGEVLGIIGRNGAGKSTLLRILAGTLNATSGDVHVAGRVSAILELGTGFHDERTGRENILLGGMCLGMSRAEIQRKMDAIITFSELEEFIDQPFKTYSSGMKARLTFAVAVSVEPDVFIIDEALATGDLLFQEKCMRRIHAIAESGTTILFVSHSLGMIYDLCDSCLLLSHGKMVIKDEPRLVGYEYERILCDDRQRSTAQRVRTRLTVGPDNRTHANLGDKHEDMGVAAPSLDKAEIVDIQLLNSEETAVQTLFNGRDYLVRVTVKGHVSIDNVAVSFRIEQPSGTVVYGVSSMVCETDIRIAADDTIVVDFTLPCLLQQGGYLLGGGVAEILSTSRFHVLHVVREAVSFEVVGPTRFQGIVDLQSTIHRIVRSQANAPL